MEHHENINVRNAYRKANDPMIKYILPNKPPTIEEIIVEDFINKKCSIHYVKRDGKISYDHNKVMYLPDLYFHFYYFLIKEYSHIVSIDLIEFINILNRKLSFPLPISHDSYIEGISVII